ncbi:Zinc finger HIT domain-containing protein 1 [Lunasporangiospora selenospora]|uniref:Zinc finger HIT domain-containing protein 1 n=1 Tax=Lunasporangiospora selenospora TaxID=979761 RepID=A0A9P6FMW8_9FUNG|nr:Zinc finger HIT domain-containing protein 1 [Lunasporangiospora selenospora]
MSRKQDRSSAKQAPKVLDKASRARQVRHHLDSLERDNFVALNEFEAIIATAAAAATAAGPVSLTTTNLGPHGLLPPLSPAVGSIVGGIVGTIGPNAAMPMTKTGSALSGGRSKKNLSGQSMGNIGGALSGSGGPPAYIPGSHRKPHLPKKPLNQLLEESGLLHPRFNVHGELVEEPSYVTATMGPSKYPPRHFCSVCGWKGIYCCKRCGMRYCDLRCLKTHEETRCMKFTI